MDVVADRLLDVGVFSRLHRPDTGQCMPVVRRCAGNDIKVFVIERFPHIGNGFRTELLSLFNHVGRPCGLCRVRIADVEDFGARVLDKFGNVTPGSTAAASDHHNSESFVRAERAPLGARFGSGHRRAESREGRGGEDRITQKRSS